MVAHLAEPRHGGEQGLGIQFAGAGEDLADAALLDQGTAVHDGDAVCHLRDDGHVVGDEQHRHAGLALEPVDQREDLGLDGDVECRGRFVGDQQAGAAGHGHGDHHALAHAAREFVRILLQSAFRLGNPHLRHQFDRAGTGGVGGEAAVDPQTVEQLAADGEHRVERGHRLLEDHADLVAADPAHGRGAGGGEVGHVSVGAGEGDAAAGDASAAELDQAHDGERGHRLARAALTDHAERFAGSHFEADTGCGDHGATASVELDAQVGDGEDGFAWNCHLALGSSTSRRTSPNMLKASTVIATAAPGTSAVQGATSR